MNGTPRGANRILLALFGLVFLAVGALLIAVAAFPAAARWWQGWAKPAAESLADLAHSTALPGQGGSWLWIAVAVAMVLLVIAMITWVANQGKGRASTLVSTAGDAQDDGAAGRVAIGAAVAEQALKTALAERSDLVGSWVTTYELRGQPAVKVRVLPRQGVAPHTVAADVAALVQALDEVLGFQTPVLISIGAGARSRFTKAERVR
ncbi:hypothetical protein [Arthrobacter sp. 35W]|uniref:hypothetical protein n=1 Tax=Arthrobacter sp. 35W TaxID=1132441 RepID=UPI000423ADF4|nr:hypothetical protein [Arthrobacter sp. 35W]